MKRIALILTAAAISMGTAIVAQPLQDSQSKSLQEVVITGTRSATDVRQLSQTVNVIDRQTIEETNRASLLPLLTEQVPGLFITQRGYAGYGVSGGAAGNISMRGMNGSAARMIVLIDGHPNYAGIYGHPIADSYQSLMTERVEVLRGPASILYGSGAGYKKIDKELSRQLGTQVEVLNTLSTVAGPKDFMLPQFVNCCGALIRED